MLEQVLKFIRGDGEDGEQVERSYLSHLLEQLEPTFREELDDCPDHDALPLLVALIVRETGGDRFDHELDCPVADADSAALEPPPPPGPPVGDSDSEPPPAPGAPPGGDEPDTDQPEDATDRNDDDAASETSGDDEEADADVDGETREDDAAEPDDEESEASELDESGSSEEPDASDAEADDEDEKDDGESEASGDGDADDADGSEQSQEASDADEPDEASDTEEDSDSEESDGDDRAVGDEFDTGDEDAATDSDPRDELDDELSTETALETEVSEVDAAVEAEPNRAAGVDMLGETETPEVDDLRADSELVLEMGRVFLGVLVENDRLPVELQMSPQEVDQARRLLAGYFLGDEGVEIRAREMLRLVEDKFDDGMFSQARILLQLFDADESTRIENDRNLFYEDMILRFGIQRRHEVDDELREELDFRLDDYDDADELEELFDWLAENLYIQFDFFGRDADRVEHWRQLADKSERPEAAERLLEVVPADQWRLLSHFADPPVELLDEQMTAEYVADYVTEHVKTCYFILRAVGDTGLEEYLDVFFEWIDQEFDVDGPGMMPWVYNETTENNRLVDDIFEDLYDQRFASAVEPRREAWDRDDLEEALDDALETFARTDLDDIPPGHYDLGRFVLDELFDVEYPTDEFAFQMHRVT